MVPMYGLRSTAAVVAGYFQTVIRNDSTFAMRHGFKVTHSFCFCLITMAIFMLLAQKFMAFGQMTCYIYTIVSFYM